MGLADVGGYVLAGGKSSRMGQDKALLELAGKPLVLHAVTKLRLVCEDVAILSNRPELEVFAPLVRDLHEGCGPMGGLEAALEHSHHEWSLFMPVDMPFLPAAFLDNWMREVVVGGQDARVAMFTVDGLPQPLICLLHKDVRPFVREAMERGQYKVFPVLEATANRLAARREAASGRAFWNRPWEESAESFLCSGEGGAGERGALRPLTEGQRAARHLWFANLNTPEEFAEAGRYQDALDT
ncbi:MAG TPA: molybdenum cofactor guanylyltransferase [Edaphobacter sp.]|nr:molybdenum cofactor guanylyltransferase [Edaphobacter sp.]